VSRNPYLIHPEELLYELRRAYPRPEARPRPRYVPYVTFANENLYGALVYVIGEGLRGQYLRHEYFTRGGERWWAIRVGYTTTYGVLKGEGVAVPLVVLGLPTHYAFQYRLEDFSEFWKEEVPTGYVEVQESHILNLGPASRGEDPILLIDKYRIWRREGLTSPEEIIAELVERERIIEQLQRTVWEYERHTRELEANARMARAESAKLRELLVELRNRLESLAAQVTGMQLELVRLHEELRVRAGEVEAGTVTGRALMDVVHSLGRLLEELKEHVRLIAEAEEAARQAVAEHVRRAVERAAAERREERREERAAAEAEAPRGFVRRRGG